MDPERPDFERYLTAIRHEEPDRVPVAEVGIDPEVKEALLGRPIRTAQDEIDFWLKGGYDFVLVDTDLYSAPQIQQAIVRPREDTAKAYPAHHQDRNWVSTAANALQTWQDVDRFLWPQAAEVDFALYPEIAARLPKGMKVVTTFGHIFTAAWQLMGFESFCIALLQNPTLPQTIIDRLGAESMRLLERILGQDCVGAVCFQDDIAYSSGLMVSPALLRQYLFPWLRQAVELAHASGRPLIYHTDGDVSRLIPDIVEAGVDVLHPIEPDCMDIVAVKKAFGDRIALMGNVDLGYTLTRGTPAEVRGEVKFLIQNVAPGGGYLLSSANSITNYVPLENYQALLDATREYGRYPISL